MLRPLEMAHQFLEEVIGPRDTVVDATMGNGHDTLFLAKRAGHVVAFDVQEEALFQTRARLAEAGYDNVTLVHQGHEKVDEYVDQVRAAVFNLGYLPAADKSVITRPDTTVTAIAKLLDRLELGGRIAIMVYYGHEGGREEKDAVLDFVRALPQKEVTVAIYQTINQVNTPPFLIMLEKLKEYNHG